MKNIIAACICFCFISSSTYAQDRPIRPRALGVSFIMNDFTTAERIRNSSLATVLRDKQWAKFKEMSPGLAITYFKGLKPRLDFAGTLTASYVTYPLRNKPAESSDALLLEADASGTFVGSSYMFANARDWARFGLLYANDGMWKGQRILPEGWVSASIKPASAAPQGEYGYQFWLNAGQPGNPANRKFPSLPPDMFYADGYEGQYVFIIPSKKLVVVRLGQTPGPWFDINAFLQGIIESLPDK